MLAAGLIQLSIMTTATSTLQTTEAGPEADKSTLTVLIADKFEDSGVDALKRLGCRVEKNPDLTLETLGDAIRSVDPNVLIVRSTRVPESVLDAGKRLSLIVRAGAGYDTIDVNGASARGIFVANCPGKNSLAVAELTWGLILACDRRIPDQVADLREGKWAKKEYARARGLHGRTLGVIGLGQIGTAVAHRGRAFGMKVIGWSRSLTREQAEEMGIGFCESPLEAARKADVITLHVASTEETKHLIDEEFCNAMKPGAYLINTTRGAVINEESLRKVIRTRGIRAGLDVYEHEPDAGDNTFRDEIVKEPGVYGTHHIGASTDQAQEAIAAETVRVVESYMKTGEVPNCVNRAASSPATCLLTVRHLNRTGVLAHVFHVLSDGGINVEEMENIIYDGAKAACARIQLDDRPTGGQLDAIARNVNILSVDLADRSN